MEAKKSATSTAAPQQDNSLSNYTAEMLNDEMPADKLSAACWLFHFGFKVIPINPETKETARKWSFIDGLTVERIVSYWTQHPDHDIGAIIDDSIIVLDADSPESLAALVDIEKAHNVTPNLVVKTRKGEHHYFKRAADTYAKMRGFNSEIYPTAIDVKTARSAADGRAMIVLPPSTNKVVLLNEADTVAGLVEVGQDFIDAVFHHNSDDAPRPPTEQAIAVCTSRAGKHEAAEIVSYINPALSYDDWLAIIMGIHSRFNGDDVGLEIADNWSAGADNYCGREVLEYKWRSFKVGGGVNFGSVCRFAELAGADLAAIGAKYDENGDPLPSFEDLLAEAKQMDAETTEDAIQRVVVATRPLTAIQRRRIFDTIKRQTKIPLAVLNDALKEGAPESDDPDQLFLARKVVESIGKQNILAAQSFVWGWDESGVWRKQEERTLRQYVHGVIPNMVDEVSKTLVEGVTDLFKTEVFSPEHEFDIGEPESVNCLNGELTFYDVLGEWVLDSHCREHYRTTQIPVSYDPQAKAPRFAQFMAEVFKGDPDANDKAKALLQMIGYTLMAHCRHERFIILVGSGANGKSVLLSVLEALCGSINVAGVQPSQFDNKFQRAHLHGKLANIVTEIEQGEVIADAALKGIVSGEPTTVEHKHKDPFMMRPFATCWFGTNHMPHTRDFSDALFRRALVVSFNNVFKPELGNCDPLLKDKLMAELPGILNMALDAYANAIQNGFTMPVSSEEARKEWRLEADQVAQFVEDECTRDDAAEVAVGVAFKQYQNWASENGINKTLGSKSFRDRLTRLGFGDRRTNKARLVTGLRLNFNDYVAEIAYKIASNGE